MLFYVMLCHVMLSNVVMLCYAMLFYVMLSHVMLCNVVMLCCYLMLCYVMLLCYAMLCYATSPYILVLYPVLRASSPLLLLRLFFSCGQQMTSFPYVHPFDFLFNVATYSLRRTFLQTLSQTL